MDIKNYLNIEFKKTSINIDSQLLQSEMEAIQDAIDILEQNGWILSSIKQYQDLMKEATEEVPTPTPVPIPEEVPDPEPTPDPAPTPDPDPTPAPTPQIELPPQSESPQEFIARIAPYAQEDMRQNGVLASITIAQAILESGYGKTDLAQNANNLFGMKRYLSGNTWEGSVWDGVSIYTKVTKENKPDGTEYEITADFRKYPSQKQSIYDHSAYLCGAMKGSELRYKGIKKLRNYKEVAQLIKNGGYATDVFYVDKLCNIIERYQLQQYDTMTRYYRVRITWSDASSQLGAYLYLENAKEHCPEGYCVYEDTGEVVYRG